MHVSVTYYAGIASRVQKVFLQFYLKKIEYLLQVSKFPGEVFCLFLGKFRDNLLFLKLFLLSV